jgi:hypothetical protein
MLHTPRNYPPSWLPPGPPPVRPSRPRPSGWNRLAIVAGAAGLITYLWWPSIRGELDQIGRRLSTVLGMRLDPTQSDPIEDRRGERRGRPDMGNQAGTDDIGPPSWRRWGGDRPETTGGPDPRNVRLWRDCRVARNGGGLDCGPWQDGPAPEGDYERPARPHLPQVVDNAEAGPGRRPRCPEGMHLYVGESVCRYPKWQSCTSLGGSVRCGPWRDGPAPDDGRPRR